MRKKIEELRNREEGFTLVELLAVIVILGIIVAIAIPAIGSVREKAKENADGAQDALIVDAARLYDIENTIEGAGVSVTTLEEAGYLEKKPADKTQNPRGMVEKVKSSTDGDKSFSFVFKKGTEQ